MPNEHNFKATQSQIDTFPIETIPNGPNDPHRTQSQMDKITIEHNFEWTRSQMNTVANGHLHLHSYFGVKNCLKKI